jgi:protease I
MFRGWRGLQERAVLTDGEEPKMATPKVAMVLANNFEDAEAIEPKNHLEALGAEVITIGVSRGQAQGKKGGALAIERTFADVAPEEFDLLVIPGGGAPENLRIDDDAVAFTRRFVESGKPVGAICHGPQLLISAKVLEGRTLTCVNKIRDDVMNAGAMYVDAPLVIDENLITSRVPGDLPQFNDALAQAVGLGALTASTR